MYIQLYGYVMWYFCEYVAQTIYLNTLIREVSV